MKCSNCSREMNQEDEFCGGCGSQLTVSPTPLPNSCPGCMSSMSPTQTHCQKCGSSRNLFTTIEPTQISAGSSRSSRWPGAIFISIGLAVIISALINYQVTGNSLRTDNNPAVGLQHILSFPLGIVGALILIAGLVFLRESRDES